MNMIQQDYRNEIAASISNLVSDKDLMPVLNAIDIVLAKYDITPKTTDLTIYQDKRPVEFDYYIANCHVNNLSQLTINNYGLILSIFFEAMHNRPLKDIKPNEIQAFLYWYQYKRNPNHQLSGRSIDKVRQILHRFFDWCLQNEYITKNPMVAITKIKFEKKQRLALNTMELEMVRKVCTSPRDKAMLEFFFSTGCRVSELAIVKKSDIDWDRKTVLLFGKGRKQRTSYINDRCYLALKDYLKSRTDDNPYLFVSINKPHTELNRFSIENIVNTWHDKSGINKPLTPHILRHTFATLALKNGMNITSIQKVLGHENVATTMVYAEVNQEQVQLEHSKAII